MPFAESLSAFFSTTDFAQDATWSVGPATVQVIFDNAGALIEVGDVAMRTTNPTCVVRTAQMATAAKGQTLVINSVTYTIQDIEPDGTGTARLHLQAP